MQTSFEKSIHFSLVALKLITQRLLVDGKYQSYYLAISVKDKVPSLISRLNLTLRVSRVTMQCRLISYQRQDVTVFY